MILKNSYIVLVVSLFCFIGFPCIQSISCFGDLFEEQSLVIDISSEEEGKNSEEESKESDAKNHFSQAHQGFLGYTLFKQTFFEESGNVEKNTPLEVSTPPPEIGA